MEYANSPRRRNPALGSVHAGIRPLARTGGTLVAVATAVDALTAFRAGSLDEEKTDEEKKEKEEAMAESVYKIIELVGTSTESWEKAAQAAVIKAAKTLRDLRIAEVSALDLQVENGKIRAYRAKVKLSFKYEGTA
jgi:hypothetical protein